MSIQNISKPQPSEVRELIKRTNTQLKGFKTVIDSEKPQREAVRRYAQALYDDRYKSVLKQMDIDHLSKGRQGIRVALLKEAGINNIWQAKALSFQQICDIEGLGEQSARKILDLIRQIEENTKKNLKVRINPDSPVKADDDLIKALYIMVQTKPVREACNRIYSENTALAQAEMNAAKKAKSGFSWVLASKAKRSKAAEATDSLKSRLAGEFGSTIYFESFNKIQDTDTGACYADFSSNSAAYYAALESVGKDFGTSKEADIGLSAQLLQEIEAHNIDLTHLKATLRSYQTFGVKYIVHQKRTLLGDEMGLGKTMQAIASMVALKAEGVHHFMVVCPASVLINWCREIEKFSDLEVTKIHGGDEAALRYWRENGNVAVTTYESISRFELPEKFKIGMVIADEAHYAKNPNTIRTKSLIKLLAKTENVLFMSGTPLENRVDEMCFLVSCLQQDVASEIEKVKHISTAEQFRQALAPVYLRRTREDVLTELPELIEKEQWVELNNEEKSAYREAVLSENFMAMRQVSWNVASLERSSKAQRLLELCDQAKEQGRKVIVFSFFRNTLARVEELLSDRCMPVISGDVSPQRRQEIVDEFTKASAGAVLISQVQAGGTGLNIQSASVIIFCEPQIKPSIENQAISRAYRMGQVRDVLVYRLLCDETVDERMLELLSTKQLEFDSFAEDSVVGDKQLELESKHADNSWIAKLVAEEKAKFSSEESSKISINP